MHKVMPCLLYALEMLTNFSDSSCLHKLNLYCSEAVFTGGANFVWSNLFKSSYDLSRTWSGQLRDFNSLYPSLPTDHNKYVRFNLSTA